MRYEHTNALQVRSIKIFAPRWLPLLLACCLRRKSVQWHEVVLGWRKWDFYISTSEPTEKVTVKYFTKHRAPYFTDFTSIFSYLSFLINMPIGAFGFTKSLAVWRKYKSKQITKQINELNLIKTHTKQLYFSCSEKAL